MTGDGLDMIRKRMKEKRIALGYSYQDVANLTGLSKSTLQRYETGSIRQIPPDKLQVLARALECRAEYLLGWDDEGEANAFCGEADAKQPSAHAPSPPKHVRRTNRVVREWKGDLTMICPDDSMAPSLKAGDLVAIRRQWHVENGEIAAVQTEQGAAFRRIYQKEGQLILQPENPAYAPTVFANAQVNDVCIIGKVIGVCRTIG